MNNFFLLDIMLENEKMLYLSLFIVIVLGYFIFNKLNILSLFILAIFIGVKIAIHNYVDNYIDSNKKLKSINRSHIFVCTMLVSLLITFPAIIISKKLGIEE